MFKQYQTRFKTGQHLFLQGDDGDSAFIIESGTVEVYITKADKKLIIATLVAGDLLGEMAIIDSLPRTASACALEDTTVIVIPRDYVQQKIKLSDPTVRFFLEIIMERYRDMHSRLMHVFEGINPTEASYKDMYCTTSNVVKHLMHQYLDMQDRILVAVNSTSPLTEIKNSRENKDAAKTKRSLNIEKSLVKALQNNEFRLFYQPIIDLKTRQIKGCEALVRWQHPKRGLLDPFEFISHAENTGIIIPLGYWIAKKACQFQQEIYKKHNHHFFTNINLSGKQFEDKDLIINLTKIVKSLSSETRLIKFEITESLLMSNPEQICDSLKQLKKCGLKLAIDDFGTGYSSLSYLHQFPFDTLKIDRSFVSTLLQNKKSNEIVKSLIDLAHNLGMNVVAEGIETPFEENIIQQYNAEFGQGYLYSKPVDAENFIKLLQ